MRYTNVRALAAIAAALVALPWGGAGAQGPRGADSLTAAAVAESLVVLKALDSVIAASPTNAAVWHRRGMLAWALTDRARATPPISGLDWTSLGRMADTSLRLAAQLAPQNAMYRMMVGRYLLHSGVSITRFASAGFFEEAIVAARQDTNSLVRAETAIEAGRVHWRRYDALANRRLETQSGSAIRSIVQAATTVGTEDNPGQSTSLRAARQALELNSMPLPANSSGRNDYDQAEALFREAYDAAPAQPRAFRQLAMLLADKDRWLELATLARGRIGRTPWDPWAWMTLGLATHRQRDSRMASVAFDSAMKLFDKNERAHIDRIERILRRSDTAVVTRGSESDRAATRRLYWLFADPLWSREGNESRIEFLARATYAELRWTVEELNVRGLDSDRGDIYVRYGPPDLVAAFGGDVALDIAMVSTIWAYNSGLIFAFEGAPTFATARIPLDDQRYADDLRDAQPVRWDNLANIKVDSMPSQVARFRAVRDSIDILVAAEPPVLRIKASSQLGFNARADFWLLAGGTVSVYQDSVTALNPGVRTWTRRVGPGNYVYRIEASTDGGKIATRATAPVVASTDPISGFSPRGFGLSDLLMASKVEPKAGTSGRRWSDLQVAPIATSIPFGSEIALLWETYDFGVKEGSAQYHVAVIVQREKSSGGRLMAKIVGGVAGAIGVDRTDDRVAMRFARTVPHAAAFADYLSVGLEDTPPGNYRVTVEITDDVSGRTVVRAANFVIVK